MPQPLRSMSHSAARPILKPPSVTRSQPPQLPSPDGSFAAALSSAPRNLPGVTEFCSRQPREHLLCSPPSPECSAQLPGPPFLTQAPA